MQSEPNNYVKGIKGFKDMNSIKGIKGFKVIQCINGINHIKGPHNISINPSSPLCVLQSFMLHTIGIMVKYASVFFIFITVIVTILGLLILRDNVNLLTDLFTIQFEWHFVLYFSYLRFFFIMLYISLLIDLYVSNLRRIFYYGNL